MTSLCALCPNFHCTASYSHSFVLSVSASQPSLLGTPPTHPAILTHAQPGRTRELVPYGASLDQKRMGASGQRRSSQRLHFTGSWFTLEPSSSCAHSAGWLPNTPLISLPLALYFLLPGAPHAPAHNFFF